MHAPHVHQHRALRPLVTGGTLPAGTGLGCAVRTGTPGRAPGRKGENASCTVSGHLAEISEKKEGSAGCVECGMPGKGFHEVSDNHGKVCYHLLNTYKQIISLDLSEVGTVTNFYCIKGVK